MLSPSIELDLELGLDLGEEKADDFGAISVCQ